MKKILLVILLCLPLTVTWAVGEHTFKWTPPTTYTDDTPLAQEDIREYVIECNGEELATIPNQPLNTDTYEAPPGTFPPGNYTCVGFTVTTQGISSDASNPVNFTVAPGQPSPPVFVVQ